MSLQNANLTLLEVIINQVLNSRDEVELQQAINDLSRFMHNQTTEAK